MARSAYSFYVCNGPDHEILCVEESDEPARDLVESIRHARVAAKFSLILP
ncbi:uncharacterized protein PHALS_10824 [Plasmopara halstedii]|uniref:Uncharacterized protein n=1 Tax=Plasmopara halstedii TaxID=4781 RepID=A0A0P1AIG3_PLAHL|nr:uncharacterized protein PHALS_10824 [Plasmopara halstedii]CEG40638.1 hypothetical protein PHALS_10824 [Plasmopara halstedii]|eukprot:XP_024577007.1 hypothetical protein PHALS_10824 [Plasmopara halstedii]